MADTSTFLLKGCYPASTLNQVSCFSPCCRPSNPRPAWQNQAPYSHRPTGLESSSPSPTWGSTDTVCSIQGPRHKRRAFHISPSAEERTCLKSISQAPCMLQRALLFHSFLGNLSNADDEDRCKSSCDDQAKEVEQTFMRSPSTLLWLSRVGEKQEKRCWSTRVKTRVRWSKRQMKNGEKHLPKAKARKHGDKQPALKSIFSKEVQRL